MSREKIATAIRAQAGVKTKAEAEAVMEAIIGAIVEALGRGEKVELRDFGTFAIKGRAARKGRDLKTGALIDIPATKVVIFTPGGTLKQPAIVEGKPAPGAGKAVAVAGAVAAGAVAAGTSAAKAAGAVAVKAAAEVKDKTAKAAQSCKKAVE